MSQEATPVKTTTDIKLTRQILFLSDVGDVKIRFDEDTKFFKVIWFHELALQHRECQALSHTNATKSFTKLCQYQCTDFKNLSKLTMHLYLTTPVRRGEVGGSRTPFLKEENPPPTLKPSVICISQVNDSRYRMQVNWND